MRYANKNGCFLEKNGVFIFINEKCTAALLEWQCI